MADTYQPMFNRTYLKIMLWVVAIAIVILSASGQDNNDYISVQQQENKPLYYVNLADNNNLELQLIFALQAALSDQQKLLHSLLSQRLQQHLETPAVNDLMAPLQAWPSVTLQDDRVTLHLSIPAQQNIEADALNRLVRGVLQSINNTDLKSGIDDQWARLKAEQYLQNQDAENHLFSRFSDTLSNDSSVHPLQRFSAWFRNRLSSPYLSMVIYGPDAEFAAQTLAPVLEDLSDFKPSRLDSTPLYQQETLPAIGNQAYSLAGRALPGRQSDSFIAQLLAARSLQQVLPSLQPRTSARLLWKSLDQTGYFALFLYGDQPPRNQQRLGRLNDQLISAVDDDLIEATRSSLKESFLQRMSNQQAQLALLNTLVFYRLPVDYMPDFAAQLEATDNAAVSEQIASMLNPSELQFFYLPAR